MKILTFLKVILMIMMIIVILIYIILIIIIIIIMIIKIIMIIVILIFSAPLLPWHVPSLQGGAGNQLWGESFININIIVLSTSIISSSK